MASAICRISVSLMLQPKVFQLFQPIGGVRATPFSSACAAGAEATLRAPEISNSPATSAVFRRLTGYRLVHCWFAAAVQVQDDLGAVGGGVAVDVQAETGLGIADRAVGVQVPPLVGAAVAVPQLRLGARGGVGG